MRALVHSLIAGLITLFATGAQAANDKARCEALSVHGAPATLDITATIEGSPASACPTAITGCPRRILHFGPGSGDASVHLSKDRQPEAFCRVEGIAPTAIRFEIWLPVKGWNGRLLGIGNGAMAGAVPSRRSRPWHGGGLSPRSALRPRP